MNLPGHGRKPKLSPRVTWKLCCEVNINPRIILKDISKIFDMLSICVSTFAMQHCLNRNVLYRNQPWQTPLHKPGHVARFNFAKMFLTKKIVLETSTLSDERKIELLGYNDVQKIWHKKGEIFFPKNTVPTLKHEGTLIMFLGYFSSREMGRLIAIRGIIKSEDYIRILGETLQLSEEILYLGQRYNFPVK